MNFFKKLRDRIATKAEEVTTKFMDGFARTRQSLTSQLDSLFRRRSVIDEAFFEELEETLIKADVGVTTAMMLVEQLRKTARAQKLTQTETLQPLLLEQMAALIQDDAAGAIAFAPQGPTVILLIGVNGVGKTTTIGKLAHRFQQEGKSVLLAAGDTFRAAAIEQLTVWGQRAGVQVVHQAQGSDPAAVIFDAIRLAKQQKIDVLLCDTAGRLHNKTNLMEELHKIVRIIRREIPEAPHEVLLVLDATTGQNALSQAKLFGEKEAITGVILTKLDGTAKGGIVLAIKQQLHIPVKFVGLGEKQDDLQPFDAQQFVHALFATKEE